MHSSLLGPATAGPFFLFVAARGSIEIIGLKVYCGWVSAVLVAAVQVLTLPLFFLSTLVWCAWSIGRRVRERHPEPFLGPDFNAAAVIMAAAAAEAVNRNLDAAAVPFGHTLALVVSAAMFMAVQTPLTWTTCAR